jgi:transposase-like protein
VVLAFEASGQSVREFARRHGLQEQRLRMWVKKLGQAAVKRERPAFVPVRIALPARAVQAPTSSSVQIMCSSGRIVRVERDFDGELLKRVLLMLEEGSC